MNHSSLGFATAKWRSHGISLLAGADHVTINSRPRFHITARGGATVMPHADLEELLNALLPFAQEMLTKHGEFYPFGASVDAKGEIAVQAADSCEENAASEKVIDMLVAGMRDEARRGEIR